jgi:putative flippase GtrA
MTFLILPGKILNSRFFRFCVIGTIGFIADALVLQTGLSVIHLSPVAARIPSFMLAVLVTWYFNRDFTFRQPERTFLASFPKYLLANIGGLSLNLAVYFAGIRLSFFLAHWPVMALAIASVSAMFFNFTTSHFLIFKKRKTS